MYVLNSLERGLRPGCVGSRLAGEGLWDGAGVGGQHLGEGWAGSRGLAPQAPAPGANSLPYLGGPTSTPRSPRGLQQSWDSPHTVGPAGPDLMQPQLRGHPALVPWDTWRMLAGVCCPREDAGPALCSEQLLGSGWGLCRRWHGGAQWGAKGTLV